MIARPRPRSLSMSELLDESFRLYRNNFLTFVLIAALVLVPYRLLVFAVVGVAESTDSPVGGLDMLMGVIRNNSATNNAGFLGLLFSAMIQPVLFGALILTTAQHYQHQSASIGGNFHAALRRLPALMRAFILLTVIYILALLPLLIFAFFGLQAYSSSLVDSALSRLGANSASPSYLLPILLSIAALLFFVPVLLLTARLQYSAQAIMLEESGAIQSIERSWTLTRDSMWRVFGYSLVVGLLTLCLTTFPAAAIALGFSLLGFDQSLVRTIQFALSSSGEIIVTPFSLIAYTLMFYDLRVRKEGFDLELEQQNLFQPNSASVDYSQSLSS